jgi:hypothetical protein
VYTYRTHGQERAAIPGGSRNLPDTTTITVEPAECGESEEWDASTEHSESRTLCVTGDSIRLASFTSRIAFYGFGNTDTYTCGTDAVVYSPDAEPGTATTFSCHGDNGTATETLTEVGYQHLTVGGTRVETLHVHVDATLTGDNKGHSSQDLWVTTDNSVLVRTKVSTDATGSGVHYTSAYRLDLTNLTPKR